MVKFNIGNAVFVIVAGLALAAAGCASTPDFGDQVSQVSRDWKKAEDKVARGEKLIREGRQQVRKGDEQQSKGASDERTASRDLEDAKRQYDLVALTVGTAATAQEAQAQGKQLRSLERTVSGAEDDLKEARARQQRGQNTRRDGRAKIKKGERLVAEGDAEMKAIEANYRNLSVLARRPGATAR